MSLVRGGLMVVAMLLVAGVSAEAQDCGNVSYIACGYHKMPWPAFTLYNNVHNDCRLCDSGGGGGDDWSQCHASCNETFYDDDARQAYSAALEAARKANVKEVLIQAARTSGRVAFNAGRQSIQILGCDGNVVASLGVRDASLLMRAAGLPTPAEARNAVLATAAQHLVLNGSSMGWSVGEGREK